MYFLRVQFVIEKSSTFKKFDRNSRSPAFPPGKSGGERERETETEKFWYSD